MLFIQIPNSDTMTLPGAPKINISDYERALSSIPGLYAVFDPATALAGGTRKARLGGGAFTALPADAAPAAQLNNLPAIHSPTAVARGTSTVLAPRSYTVAVACHPTAAGYVFGVGAHRIRLTSATSLAFQISHTTGNNASYTVASRLGLTSILSMSYDADTHSLAGWLNGFKLGQFTPAMADTNTAWPTGGLYAYNSASDGCTGYFGDVVSLDHAAHVSSRSHDALMAAMKAKYGVA